MTARVLAEPILVGREQELKQLQTLLESAIGGNGKTVFVAGEAGSGKTRLVTEFINQIKKQETATVLTGWCLSNAAVPYFPFFEAFREYFSKENSDDEVEIKSWLLGPPKAQKFGDSPIVTPQVWKDQTFTAVANTFASISAKNTVILFIDDLHWADSASLALIHYLANTIRNERVLILATFRSEQLIADAEGRPHPLMETLRLMKRQDLIKEINVASLGENEVRNLAKDMLGGNVDRDLSQKLATESQGNPLFIVESLRMLNESDGLVQERDQWRLTSTAIGIPPKIKDIILQRFGTLLRSQKDILEVASVIGEKFDPQLLSLVLGEESITVIRALEKIAKDTSLIRSAGQLYCFDHGRTRDAICDDISPALRRSYHEKVAEKLESKKDKLPLSDLAHQFAKAGNMEKAVKYALAAGQDALAKWSNIEAVNHFIFVINTLKDDSKSVREKIIALEGLGDAYYASNNFVQAIKTYEVLADLGADDVKVRALRKAMHASFYQADLAWNKALIRKADGLKVEDRLEAARMLYLKCSVLAAEGQWAATNQADKEALKIFEEEYALSDAANILLWLGYGDAMLGQLETAVAYALRSVVLFDELGDFRSQIESYAYAGGTFQACALDAEAKRMFAKAVEVNEQYKIWDYVRLFPAYVWETIGLVAENPPEAIVKGQKALEYFEKTDSRLYAGAVYGSMILASAFMGDLDCVNKYYGKFQQLPNDIKGNAPSQIYLAPVMGAYHAARGEFEQSNKWFSGAIAAMDSTFPNPFLEASGRQLYAWALGKQGNLMEAKTQLDTAQKVIQSTRSRFNDVNVIAALMTSTRPKVNQRIPVRLDLVNVSVKQASIIKVEGLPEQLITEVSPNCILNNNELSLKDDTINPFTVKTIKLTLKTPKPTEGNLKFNPVISYTDVTGVIKTCSPRPFTIVTQQNRQEKSGVEICQDGTDAEIDILKRFGLNR